MKLKSFWLSVSVFIIVIGSCAKSEAHEIPTPDGTGFAKSEGRVIDGL